MKPSKINPKTMFRFSGKQLLFHLFSLIVFTNVRAGTVQVFENFWKEAKANIYPVAKEEKYFTDTNYILLKQKAIASNNLYELSVGLNEFLKSLNVSHTGFYTDQTFEFYVFRSLFSTKDIHTPKINHIGVQTDEKNGVYIIRQILEGYPAYRAGLRRGDVLLEVNGRPFHPYGSFNPLTSKKVTLEIQRNRKKIIRTVIPVYESPHFSFLNAMIESKKIYSFGSKKVGYIHLWSGTNEKILKTFKRIIKNEFLSMDGIILDLRGGFGGAWYDYLDPFFQDRKDFFKFTWIDREGNQKINMPGKKGYRWHYFGPMVVLINEGVRSGKESLAYQFKKSKRAVVIGETTQGAFTAGKGIFNDQKLDYFLYLATAELLLDGQVVEGVGIAPEIKVPYPLEKSLATDPQLQRGISEIKRVLGEK